MRNRTLIKYIVYGMILALLLSALPLGNVLTALVKPPAPEPPKDNSVDIPQQKQSQQPIATLPTHYVFTSETLSRCKQRGIVRFGRTVPIVAKPTASPSLKLDSDPVLSAFIGKHDEALALPVDEEYFSITSDYGLRQHPIDNIEKNHWGIDIGKEGIEGQPVYAVLDGVVKAMGDDPALGYYVILTHNNGQTESTYGHLGGIPDNIIQGAEVSKKQIIGFVGSTGASTGPHLHFEYKMPVDPQDLLEN